MASGDPFSDSVSTYTNYDWNVAATGSASESEQNTKSTHHGWNALRAAVNFLNQVANGSKEFGYMPWFYHHGYVPADGSGYNLPWSTSSETAEVSEDHTTVFIAPHDGYLHAVQLVCSASMGASCGVEIFSDNGSGDHTTVTTSLGTEVTADMSTADTVVEFSFGSSYSFSKGDLLKIVVDPNANPSGNGIIATSHWRFDTRT